VTVGDADRIRRAYQVWNESGPAGVVDGFYAENAIYRESPEWPGAGVYQGRDAIVARLQSLVDLIGPFEVRIDRLVDAGDDLFVAITEMIGEAAKTDAPYTQSFGVVHRMRDGMIVEADYYLHPTDALRAAGIKE
jgi:ketosteroid isomerase-like protein